MDSTYIIRIDLNMELLWGSPIWLDKQARELQGSTYICPRRAGVTDVYHPPLLHRSWWPEWGPQACVTSTLPTEPALQPQEMVLMALMSPLVIGLCHSLGVHLPQIAWVAMALAPSLSNSEKEIRLRGTPLCKFTLQWGTHRQQGQQRNCT